MYCRRVQKRFAGTANGEVFGHDSADPPSSLADIPAAGRFLSWIK